MKSSVVFNHLDHIFRNNSDNEFESVALEVFRFQYDNNIHYKDYVDALKIAPGNVKKSENIPFLPIRFFKSKDIATGEWTPECRFTSSGTTGSTTSKHLVKEKSIYQRSYLECFNLFYGSPSDYAILALLPSYLERQGSSLIDMAEDLVNRSGHQSSGFYLYNHEELFDTLQGLQAQGQKTILLGVTFALLDFAEKFRMQWPDLIIMETGGMKGRKKELTRMEVHDILRSTFGTSAIHSEYGMTELLSQAYSYANGIYQAPPWMRVFVRDTDDPLSCYAAGKGGINIIDLANVYSCSFIATEDLGTSHPNRTFEILGRFDQSDARGCNLMMASF